MRQYIDILEEFNFLTESYESIPSLKRRVLAEDFSSFYQKGKQIAQKILASGKPWEQAAEVMAAKVMQPQEAQSFLARAKQVATSVLGDAKTAAAVLALCGVVMLAHNAQAASMTDQQIGATMQQLTPVQAQPIAGQDVQAQTPNNVQAQPIAGQAVAQAQTPNNVQAQPIAPSQNVQTRSPVPVQRRPLSQ